MENHRRSRGREVREVRLELALRASQPADHGFVRRLTVAAFAAYGDYESIMDGWLADPRTRTVIAEIAGPPGGFAMWAASSQRSPDVVLVALALTVQNRGRGCGQRLLEEVHWRIAAEAPGVAREVALDVAADNLAARALFIRAGYRETPTSAETYPCGQRALRMRVRLSASAL